MTPKQTKLLWAVLRWPLRLLFLPLMLFVRTKSRSPAFQREVMARWYNPTETAPWFGHTGLGDDLERELAPYLRRELGSDVHELPAARLSYHGMHEQEGCRVHYWQVPATGFCEGCWATIAVDPNGQCSYSNGEEAPPG